MLKPGPDHPIMIEPAANRWRAFFAGHVIADSAEAVIVKEAALPPVVYFPRADVAMEYMARADRRTYCPYKGDAAYYTILMDGQFADNAVWSYEDPYPGMQAIAGRIAFYTDKVEVYEVDDAVVNPHPDEPSVDDIVQHTDEGDGVAQRAPWPPSVSGPAEEEGGSP